jgi:hypothetical protein
MNCFGWNCRGAGNNPTVRELCDLVRETRSCIVFLCETRQKAERVRCLRGRLGLRGFTGVDSDGLSGGLALFWSDQIHVEDQSSCERFVDVHVRIADDQPGV